MIELQYKLDISQALYDDVLAFVAQHGMTIEELLEMLFVEIHAQRTLNANLHSLSSSALERQRQYEADFAASFDEERPETVPSITGREGGEDFAPGFKIDDRAQGVMLDVQYKLDISQELYDEVAAFVAMHEITIEGLLEEFFTEIHATRTLNPLLHILCLERLEMLKESDAEIAAGLCQPVTIEELLAEIDEA